MEHLAASKRSARILLAAWESADSRRIRTAAYQAEVVAAPVSTFEAERLEMVREAGGVLREWTEGARGASDVEASLRLLRHLAGLRHSRNCYGSVST